MKNLVTYLLVVFITCSATAQKGKSFEVRSPDGKIIVTINVTKNLSWSVKHENTQVLIPSFISLLLNNGEVLGRNFVVNNSKISSVQSNISTALYKKAIIPDNYNQLVINFKNNYSVVFRAYND